MAVSKLRPEHPLLAYVFDDRSGRTLVVAEGAAALLSLAGRRSWRICACCFSCCPSCGVLTMSGRTPEHWRRHEPCVMQSLLCERTLDGYDGYDCDGGAPGWNLGAIVSDALRVLHL